MASVIVFCSHLCKKSRTSWYTPGKGDSGIRCPITRSKIQPSSDAFSRRHCWWRPISNFRVLLGHVIEEARSMTGARYGALGVLNEDRTELAEFLTVGLDPDEEDRIGHRPTGQGVLGLLITEPQPLRLADLGSHPDSFGFPVNHPPMASFLGVPIKVRDEVYGNLYLTDKVGWSEFTQDDVALVEALAVAAGIAIENARLHEQRAEGGRYRGPGPAGPGSPRHGDPTAVRSGSLPAERGVNGGSATGDGPARCDNLVEINDTMHEVRSAIYALGMAEMTRGVRASVLALVRDLAPVVGFEVEVTVDGPLDYLRFRCGRPSSPGHPQGGTHQHWPSCPCPECGRDPHRDGHHVSASSRRRWDRH